MIHGLLIAAQCERIVEQAEIEPREPISDITREEEEFHADAFRHGGEACEAAQRIERRRRHQNFPCADAFGECRFTFGSGMEEAGEDDSEPLIRPASLDIQRDIVFIDEGLYECELRDEIEKSSWVMCFGRDRVATAAVDVERLIEEDDAFCEELRTH